MSSGSDEKKAALRAVAVVGQLGAVIALPIAAGAVLGLMVERRYDTGGIAAVGLILVGVLAGVLSAYRLIRPYLK